MDILHDIVYPSVDEIIDMLDDPSSFTKEFDTKLIGPEAMMDSILLVSFIVAVEGMVEDKTDLSITIANERAMSRTNSPFLTLGSLADYVTELVAEAKGDA